MYGCGRTKDNLRGFIGCLVVVGTLIDGVHTQALAYVFTQIVHQAGRRDFQGGITDAAADVCGGLAGG